MAEYDFFIAHASADKADAEIFFELLSREAAVFLDRFPPPIGCFRYSLIKPQMSSRADLADHIDEGQRSPNSAGVHTGISPAG